MASGAVVVHVEQLVQIDVDLVQLGLSSDWKLKRNWLVTVSFRWRLLLGSDLIVVE